MRVLVYAHQLEIGGTQTNAIELAAALRDQQGCEVTVFATPGPMVGKLHEKRLPYIPAPQPNFYPSPARIRALRRAVLAWKPDVIHVWDWWQCLDAFYGVHLTMEVPLVVTDMNMSLVRVLPKFLPTTFGFPSLVERARAAGRTNVELLLPPVDTSINAPTGSSGAEFRQAHGIAPSEIALVTVSRLSRNMKSDSIGRTARTVQELGQRLPLRFLLVGEGAARNEFELMARSINSELGRRAIILTGPMLDPRPAYDAADIVVGMGGSALRGMAFRKPVIVTGDHGFANVLSPETSDFFLWNGIFGQRGDEAHSRPLSEAIAGLAVDNALRSSLGHYSRKFVEENFSLDVLSGRLVAILRNAVSAPRRWRLTIFDGVRTAAVYMRERRFLTAVRMEPPGGRSPDPSVLVQNKV